MKNPKTIWQATQKKFPTLTSDISCDVAIIGGGIAGLWCAYHLVNAGKKVCIIEAKKIGSGVTAGSTAIFTYAQDVIYNPIIKKHGIDVAKKYLEDTKTAINEVRKIIEKEKVACEFEPIDFVLFSTKGKGSRALKKEQKAYAELGIDVAERDLTKLPYSTKKELKFSGAFQINPLKLCAWLADYVVKNGGQIFENTLVHEAPEGKTLKLGNNKSSVTITAENFVVATHFPYINVPGFYWLKIYQHQNYCMVFKPKGKRFADFCKGTSYESIDESGFEYRRVGENILVDGVPVRTGQKPYKSKYRVIEKHLRDNFGEYKEVTRFCSQDCITMDKLPYAGRYSHFADNVFVVTGFNKWGMTNSYITAKVVTDMISGKVDKDAEFNAMDSGNIYSPQRVALFVNLIETVSNVGVIGASFANDLLNIDAKKFDRIGKNQGAIIKYKGHRVGASRDERGRVTLIAGTCPHLHCNLKWNKDEMTFDCPCHGSRFDTQGNIINNPSTKNAERVEMTK